MHDSGLRRSTDLWTSGSNKKHRIVELTACGEHVAVIAVFLVDVITTTYLTYTHT